MNACLQLYFDEIFIYAQDQMEPLCINLFESTFDLPVNILHQASISIYVHLE